MTQTCNFCCKRPSLQNSRWCRSCWQSWWVCVNASGPKVEAK